MSDLYDAILNGNAKLASEATRRALDSGTSAMELVEVGKRFENAQTPTPVENIIATVDAAREFSGVAEHV